MKDPALEFKKIPLKTLTSIVRCSQIGFYRFNESVGVDVDFQRSETTLSYHIPYGVVISLIGIVGDVHGGLSVILDRDSFSRYVSALTGGLILPDINDEIALSAIGEMLNMIAGRMALEMSNQGFQIDITPPQIFAGEKIKQTESRETAHIILPYRFYGKLGTAHLVLNRLSESSL